MINSILRMYEKTAEENVSESHEFIISKYAEMKGRPMQGRANVGL